MKFSDFGFKKFINDCLVEMNISVPTQIQQKVIPYFKKKQSIIGKSNTGTGKTLAFLLPILNNINYDLDNKIQATIIAPTRELATQIYNVASKFIKFEPRLTMGLFNGGENTDDQVKKLDFNQPMLCVGTPTRIKKLYDNNSLKITTSDYFVIDECDMIFDFGFIEDVDALMSKINEDCRKLVFSATINTELKVFLEKYLKNSIYIDVKEDTEIAKNISNILIWTKNRENKDVVQNIVKSINPYVCLIFVNKNDMIPTVESWLHELNIKPAVLSGSLESSKRKSIFKKINDLEYRFVICTDLASRGIDIKGVSHVISIDLPIDLKYYTHRSGRTGRADQTGISYILHNSSNQASIDLLKSKGIKFSNVKLVNGEFVSLDKPNKNNKKQKHFDTNINRIKSKIKNAKVKPGYKKKNNEEIEKYKAKKRREHIKESINKIKKDKYKKRRDEIFDN